VNTVMDLGFYKRRGISRLDKWLLAFQEGLCSMELFPPALLFSPPTSSSLILPPK
jgi:hypothetical protein